jgi:DNA-directed RNA polymerase subunit RPC12/RpoP
MVEDDSIDITPNPRVLRMLGQIEFENWQCLAELIDNSIDALMNEGGGNIGISTPTQNEYENNPDASITVWDNGPGMSRNELQNALKAGYSGNDPLSKLGLFGMGFNIATARLGKVTETRTTRMGDKKWIGVTIDFDEMEKSNSYKRSIRSYDKENKNEHGTYIKISNLYERVRTIRKQKIVKHMLSTIYSPILKENSIEIVIDGDKLKSSGFCLWNKDRFVERDGKKIQVFYEINEDLGEEYYCKNCWNWIEGIPAQKDISNIRCPDCGDSSEVVRKQRRLWGWIGVQRYFDLEGYGINLIRNGRVIEPLDKTLFSWKNPETSENEKEYPIDTLHWGGRIVGELNIDFLPLTYMKDHFEKADKRWNEVVKVVRGDGPLRPLIAKKHNYTENESPLAQLFKGYRTGSKPGKLNLVPGNEKGDGINEEPKRWALKYYEGDPDYQEDNKWWEAVLLAEISKRSSGVKGSTSQIPLPTPAGKEKIDDKKTHDSGGLIGKPIIENTNTDNNKNTTNLEKDVILSKEYSIKELRENPLHINVNKSINGNLGDFPVKIISRTKDSYEVLYNPKHQIFKSFNVEPLDLILIEISNILSRRNDDPTQWPPSRIYYYLKDKYSENKLLSPSVLCEKSNETLSSIKKYLVNKKVPVDEDTIDEQILNELRKNVLSKIGGGEKEVKELIKSTKYIEFAPDDEVLNYFFRNPSIFLDGNYWKRPYKTLGTQALQEEVKLTIFGYLNDILWLKKEARDYDLDTMSKDIEYRLQRASYSLMLLEAYIE